MNGFGLGSCFGILRLGSTLWHCLDRCWCTSQSAGAEIASLQHAVLAAVLERAVFVVLLKLMVTIALLRDGVANRLSAACSNFSCTSCWALYSFTTASCGSSLTSFSGRCRVNTGSIVFIALLRFVEFAVSLQLTLL